MLLYCYLSKDYSWCKSAHFHCSQWIYTDIILFHLYLPSYLWFYSYISCLVTLFLPVSGSLCQSQIIFCRGFTYKMDASIALGWSRAHQVHPPSSSTGLALIEEYNNEDILKSIFFLSTVSWFIVISGTETSGVGSNDQATIKKHEFV